MTIRPLGAMLLPANR